MHHATPSHSTDTNDSTNDPRTRRILAMVDDVEAGRVEAEALRDRYGLSLSEARRLRKPRGAQRVATEERRRSWGRVKGIYMRPEVEMALLTMAPLEGGQGRAVARGISILALLRIHQAAGSKQVVIDLDSMTMEPAQPAR